MSHDTHQHHETPNEKPTLQFQSAFYFVIIIAGLFIATIAFVKSMSHDEGGHGAHASGHATEATHESHEAAGAEHHEAPAAEEAHH